MSQKTDTLVVITVLTGNAERRDEIDRIVGDALAKDDRVQLVRVVGYANKNEIATIQREIAKATQTR
jgi:hypothetical protein